MPHKVIGKCIREDRCICKRFALSTIQFSTFLTKMCLIVELGDGEIKLTPIARSKNLNNLHFLEGVIKILKAIILWDVTLVAFFYVSEGHAASILPSKHWRWK